MNNGSLIGRAYQNYFNLSGRASRAEYFAFLIFVVGMTTGLMVLDRLVFGAQSGLPWSLAGLFFGLHLIPLIAVFVRRLHDTDEDIPLMLVPVWCAILAGTGLMATFGMATLFGLIFITFGQLLCLKVLKDPGTTGGNRFGPDPDTPDDANWHEHLAWQEAATKVVYRARR